MHTADMSVGYLRLLLQLDIVGSVVAYWKLGKVLWPAYSAK